MVFLVPLLFDDYKHTQGTIVDRCHLSSIDDYLFLFILIWLIFYYFFIFIFSIHTRRILENTKQRSLLYGTGIIMSTLPAWLCINAIFWDRIGIIRIAVYVWRVIWNIIVRGAGILVLIVKRVSIHRLRSALNLGSIW